jgi:hypothetical protein
MTVGTPSQVTVPERIGALEPTAAVGRGEAKVLRSLSRAWRQSGFGDQADPAIDWITADRKRRKRRPVLRLRHPGHDGAIIAKRQHAEAAAREAHVYASVLPRLGLETVAVYGLVDDPEAPGQAWLLMEETGEPYQIEDPGHRCAAAAFLARLHISSAGRSMEGLPDLGSEHHEALLRRARRRLGEHLEAPETAAALANVADRLLEASDRLLSQWSLVAAACRELPTVLVHGSLRGPNLRVIGRSGARLQAIDWASAGWGPVSRDLHKLARPSVGASLDGYWDLVKSAGLYRDRDHISTAVALGQGLRLIEHFGWDVDGLEWREPESLAASLDQRTASLNSFEAWLATTARAGG